MTPMAAGMVIGSFRIRETLGAGAMGTVYLAETVDGGELVALKVLTPGLSSDERFRARFERERALAETLDHPNVVRMLSFGESEDGAFYLALEYVPGCDLRELLRREGRLEPARALALVGQAATALDAAHAAGLVHRDVKPGNILVTETDTGERALVCDFGLARHVSSVSSLTGDRGFVGTIDYVPPEQIQGNRLDGRSDLYSLACVLYECLVGAKPYERDSELSVVFAHLNDPPPRPTEFRPELAAAWDDVFATALAKEPSERFDSCREFVEAAHAAAGGTRRKGRTVRRWTVAVGVVAATAAAAVLFFGGSGTQTRPEITETAIAGVGLDHSASYYKHRFGGYVTSSASGVGFPELVFERPQVNVYFPATGRPAHIITTSNAAYTTAAGIGPCSTLADAQKAYGARWQPSPDGANFARVYSAYAVGNNLIFETQDGVTISAVGLYEGNPRNTGRGSPQAYANYVTANETSCR